MKTPRSRNPLRDPKSRNGLSGYRYYSPELGRWLNRDPLGELALIVHFVALRHQALATKSKTLSIADKRGRSAWLSSQLYKLRTQLQEKSRRPAYLFCGNSSLNYVDSYGLFKVHGRWCGPKWTGGEEKASYDYDWYGDLTDTDGTYIVDDDLDECCFSHDACCAGIDDPYDWTQLVITLWRMGCSEDCNKDLCDCVKKVSPKTDEEKKARRLVYCYFCIGPGGVKK
jgi:hypothetical protein